MLHSNFQIVDLPSPGDIADVREDRGEVTFLLQRGADLDAVLDKMNSLAEDLCQGSGWLQLWDGEVAPPSVTFELADDLPDGCGVDVQETGGRIRNRINENLTVAQFAAVMTAATEKVFSGGQWYQLWNGEIVSNAST